MCQSIVTLVIIHDSTEVDENITTSVMKKNLNRTTVVMYAIYEINEFQSCMQEPKMMAFPSCLFVLWKHMYEDQKVPHPPLKNPIPVWHFKFRRNFSCASLDKSFIKPWVCNNNITDPLSSSMPLCLNQQLLQPQLQQHCMRKPKHLDEHNPGFQNQNPFSVHQFLCNLNAISIPEKVISHVRIHLNRKEHNTCSVKFLCILFGFWKSKKASEQKAFSLGLIYSDTKLPYSKGNHYSDSLKNMLGFQLWSEY